MNARANRPAMGIVTEASHANKALSRQLFNSFGAGGEQTAIAGLFNDAAKAPANTNAPSMMIGYRAAQFISEDVT